MPPARAVTVHEGIDLERVDAAPPANLHAELWLPHHAPIVGNVAALVPHKGQRHLIEAAAIVVQQVPDARFVIAGEGELRPALERQIKERHLEKHVFLAGFRPDVLSLHKAFDIFVMSSVTEGLGTSLLDAMACGKPIVATTAGGMPEVVVDGETGLLVPPRDHEAMAAAIVRLLKDDALRRQMGEAGAARACASASAPSGWCRTRCGVYQRVAASAREADARASIRQDFSGRSARSLQLSATQTRPAARVAARTVVEGDRGAVLPRTSRRARSGWTGQAVGLDERDRAEVGAGARVEHAQLVAVDEKRDAAAVGGPGDLVAALRSGALSVSTDRACSQVRPDRRATGTSRRRSAPSKTKATRVARRRLAASTVRRPPSSQPPAKPAAATTKATIATTNAAAAAPCAAARAADSLQRTLRISLPAAEAAGVHHPDVAEREIEADRIDRIDRAQRRA